MEEPSREKLFQGLLDAEKLSTSLAADLKTGAAALSIPVALLRRGGQLIASLAGSSNQALVSSVGILKDRASGVSTRLKDFIDELPTNEIEDELNEKPLHVDLAQFTSSLKRVFKVLNS